MVNNPVGKVLDGSTTREFNFVAGDYFQGDFVQLEMNYSGRKVTVVGEIVDKKAVNPYFERPTTFNYLSDKDESVRSWNLYIVTVRPIAAISDGETSRVEFPPAPGTNVYSAEVELISSALGLEREGIPIGFLRQLNTLRVHLAEAQLCRTHFSVLGRTGSGKSYLTKGLLKSIRGRNIVVFAPTDEYNEIAGEINAQILSKDDLLLPLNSSYIASVFGLSLQEQILFERFMKKEESLTDKKRISNQEIAVGISSSIRAGFQQTEQATLPGMKGDTERFTTLERANRFPSTIVTKLMSKSVLFSQRPTQVPFPKSTIIDMSGLDQDSQEVIMMYALSNLLESYRNKEKRMDYPDLIIVIEEAHSFAPSIQTTACKNKIIQLAREGRKLGIALCLVSQRPRHFDQTVLSQCGTLFVFHTPHPEDVEHIFGVSPIYRRDLLDSVRELAVGECLVLGEAVKYPLLCSVSL